MKQYIKLMRPKHYIKNLLLFFPIVFSGSLLDVSLLLKCIYGFAAFSLITSVIYIVNDIMDAENDRQHPTKCGRPIASRKITPVQAGVFAVVLFVIGLLFQFFACAFAPAPWGLLLAYVILNVIYSLGLKNVVIVDVAILVSGFLIRVLYGAVVTDIAVSSWLYLTVIALSFYLALGKRRNELVQKGDTRKVLKFYSHAFLDKNMYLCLTLAIAFYSLWCVDPMTIAHHGHTGIIFTVPLVILICMKYSLTIEGLSDGDPVEVILKDKVLMALVAVYAVTMLCLIYF